MIFWYGNNPRINYGDHVERWWSLVNHTDNGVQEKVVMLIVPASQDHYVDCTREPWDHARPCVPGVQEKFIILIYQETKVDYSAMVSWTIVDPMVDLGGHD